MKHIKLFICLAAAAVLAAGCAALSRTPVAIAYAPAASAKVASGKTTVTVIAAETAQYKGARKTVTIISKLARPHLEVITKKGQAKLSWNRVKGAEQIQLYVKYPGKKKYEGRSSSRSCIKG